MGGKGVRGEGSERRESLRDSVNILDTQTLSFQHYLLVLMRKNPSWRHGARSRVASQDPCRPPFVGRTARTGTCIRHLVDTALPPADRCCNMASVTFLVTCCTSVRKPPQRRLVWEVCAWKCLRLGHKQTRSVSHRCSRARSHRKLMQTTPERNGSYLKQPRSSTAAGTWMIVFLLRCWLGKSST